MKYKRITEQVLNMKCNKIYKPILILAYLDFVEITDCITTNSQTMVNLDELLPFFKHYLKLESINKSAYGAKNIELKSNRELKQIIIDGPLFRIQNDVNIFKATFENKIYKFGYSTDNPSIDFNLLTQEIRVACNTLIANLLNTEVQNQDLTIYQNMIYQIKTTKIGMVNNPKIYKYLVILSYVDYFCDLGIEHLAFKQLISTEDLFTYYKLYFNIESISEFIKTPAVKDGSDKYVYNHMRQLPVRRLCMNNTFFKLIETDSNSRKTENLPTEFGIIINSDFDSDCMIGIVRYITNTMINYHTKTSIDLELVYNIKYSDEYDNNNSSRYGQNQYRNSLLERYDCTCAICNMDFKNVLIASHAKPWRDCKTTHQKLSVNNGLLLCEYHDALFDKGFITFDVDSNFDVIFSEQMTSRSIDHFYSFYDNKIPDFVSLYPKIENYLQYHHDNIFKK